MRRAAREEGGLGEIVVMGAKVVKRGEIVVGGRSRMSVPGRQVGRKNWPGNLDVLWDDLTVFNTTGFAMVRIKGMAFKEVG